MAETREVIEGLPGGGWHTVRRMLLDPPGARILICPNCGNSDQAKFKSEVRGATLHGYFCMNCTP